MGNTMKDASNTTFELSILGAMVAVAGLALLVVNVEPPLRPVASVAQVGARKAEVVRDAETRALTWVMTVSPSIPASMRSGN